MLPKRSAAIRGPACVRLVLACLVTCGALSACSLNGQPDLPGEDRASPTGSMGPGVAAPGDDGFGSAAGGTTADPGLGEGIGGLDSTDAPTSPEAPDPEDAPDAGTLPLEAGVDAG